MKRVFKCKFCNKIAKYKRQHKNIFCSNRCSANFKSKQSKDLNWKLFLSGKLEKRNRIFFCLIKRDGNQCSICHITEWQGKQIKFWVDHIDGNASNCSPKNFRLVCPNCDSQSSTFGARNFGKGRKSLGMNPYGSV